MVRLLLSPVRFSHTVRAARCFGGGGAGAGAGAGVGAGAGAGLCGFSLGMAYLFPKACSEGSFVGGQLMGLRR